MDDKLFKELVAIGISEETAFAVAASLNPDHLATKTDILRLEKLILDVQQKNTEQLASLQTKTSEQLAASNRQFTITFLGLVLTACVLFSLNLYFH